MGDDKERKIFGLYVTSLEPLKYFALGVVFTVLIQYAITGGAVMGDDERFRMRAMGCVLVAAGVSLLIADQIVVLWKQLTGVP